MTNDAQRRRQLIQISENLICKSVRSRPADATEAELKAWRHHRNRPIRSEGLCATCYREAETERRRAARASRVKRTYGLSREEHDALFVLQGGRCPHGRRIRITSPVDHDHSSGAVRGLLCDDCNRFIGRVKDQPQAFLNLWAYLLRPPAQVPPETRHPFQTERGLVQCIHWVGDETGVNRCGRLEHEHRFVPPLETSGSWG